MDEVFVEFEVGDRARVRKGEGWEPYPDGREGVIKDVFCDYGEHRVGILFDGDEKYVELSEYMFEHVYDPYEYAVQVWDGRLCEWITTDRDNDHMLPDYWGIKDERERKLGYMQRVYKHGTFKLVKRRKAGKVQDV